MHLSSKFLGKPGPGDHCPELGRAERSKLAGWFKSTDTYSGAFLSSHPTLLQDALLSLCSQSFCPEMVCHKHPLPFLMYCVLFPGGWAPWDGTESEICISDHLEKGKWGARDSISRSSHFPAPAVDPGWKQTDFWKHTTLFKNKRTLLNWVKTVPPAFLLNINEQHLFTLVRTYLALKGCLFQP